MSTRFQRAAAALAGVLALGAGSAACAASSAAAAPAATPRCTAGNLAVWVNADSGDGAAGTIYYDLDFTNTGRHACALYGYPGVSATTSSGQQQLGAPARRNSTAPAKTVTIMPDGTAHSVLGYIDGAVANCRPTRTAFALKVFPPGDTTARHAFFPLPVCTDKAVDLTIERIAAGA